MTAKQFLLTMPDALDASAAGDTAAVIQYEISEPVHHVLEDGVLEAVDGRADEPDLTVAIADDDLLALFGGRLDPLTAFMSGRLRVGGDLELAQRLVGFFDQETLTSLAPEAAAASADAEGASEAP
jgi:putative sterol carrier protein